MKKSKSVLKRCATIKELRNHFNEIQTACSGDTRFCAAASLFIAEKVNELVLETQKANLETGVALLKVLTDFIEKKENKSNGKGKRDQKRDENVARASRSSQGTEDVSGECNQGVLGLREKAQTPEQG